MRAGQAVAILGTNGAGHGCTGEMFEWWFRFRPDTQQYVWWHPVDHIFSDWQGGTPDTHVGSTHVIEEYFTGAPAQKGLVQFRELPC